MPLPVEKRMYETQITDRGEYNSSCGYCHSPGKNSSSHGLWTEHMSVEHYQGLLNRGWRRSGKYVYKPDPFESCCPLYTIRLPVAAFEMSKEQRRVQRRFHRFLDGSLDRDLSGSLHRREEPRGRNLGNPATARASDSMEEAAASESNRPETELKEKLEAAIHSAVTVYLDSSGLPIDRSTLSVTVKEICGKVKGHPQQRNSEKPVFSSNVAFLMAVAAKRPVGADSAPKSDKNLGEVNNSEQHKRTLTPTSNADHAPHTAKAVAETLADTIKRDNNLSPHVSVSAMNGHLNFYAAEEVCVSGHGLSATHRGPSVSKGGAAEEAGSKARRRAAQVGTGAEANVGEGRQGRFGDKKREYSFSMARSSFVKEEFELYKKYQMRVHGDTQASLTASSYKRFLVDSPLQPIPPSSDTSTPSCGYGSFHQQYRIDGRLVMVGVVDVLPMCLSSKYLIWDPDFSFLSLGKLSAIKEIEWVRGASRECASVEYYYLGFYCHTCPKLKYKAAYSPSHLLCPLRIQWVPYSQAAPLLQRNPASVLTMPPPEIHVNNRADTLAEQPEAKAEQRQTGGWLSGLTDSRLEGAKKREEEQLQAMVEQADVAMAEGGEDGEDGEGGAGWGDGQDSMRGDATDAHAESDEMRRLTEEEKRVREQAAEQGVYAIPLFINGALAPFQMLKSRKLLRELELKKLKQQLVNYLYLVGNDLGSGIAYEL